MSVPTSSRLPIATPCTGHFAGRWHDDLPPALSVADKTDGSELARVGDCSIDVIHETMQGAWRGFLTWRARPPRDRADVLHRAHGLIAERREQLALLIALEMGKALPEARAEVDYANAFFREYADHAACINTHTERRRPGTDARMDVSTEPIGPAVLITPWNFPAAMVARKAAPALAAACSVIIKPAELTPLTTLALVELLLEAGVDADAVSVLPTTDSIGVVRALLAHPLTRKVSFTGSTHVGRQIATQAGDRLLRMSLELGGNAPFIVCEDADIPAAIAGAMHAKFRNGGQACTAANRFLVHHSVAEQFADGLTHAADQLLLGAPTHPATTLGPMTDTRGADKLRELVNDAQVHGAHLRTGGNDKAHGRYYPATVLDAVILDARIMHEEAFGPVAPIMAVHTDEQAIEVANASDYGLASYVYSRDPVRLARLSTQLEAGMVGLNTGIISNASAPFGGIKASGYGREGGPEGLAEYQQLRYRAGSLD